MSSLELGRFVFDVRNHITDVGRAPLVWTLRPAGLDTWRTNEGRFVMYDDEFEPWFSGLVDGEGCFHARPHIRKRDGAHCLVVYFSIKLRADDTPMLEMIRETLGVGRIYTYGEKLSAYPQSDYRVSHREDLRSVIIPHFDVYPLRSKKRRDYHLWRQIVLDYKCAPRQHCSIGTGSLSQAQWDEVVALSQLLRATREFDPATADLARDRVRQTQPPLFVVQSEQVSMFEVIEE